MNGDIKICIRLAKASLKNGTSNPKILALYEAWESLSLELQHKPEIKLNSHEG